MNQLTYARKTSILFALALMYSCSHPDPVMAVEYGDKPATVIKVHDGDTIAVSIPDWPSVIGNKIPVRVYGIDTPELLGKCANEKAKALLAKAFTENFVNSKLVTLKAIKRDKYFRILASVYVGDSSLADGLLKANLARPYFGSSKSNWCAP